MLFRSNDVGKPPGRLTYTQLLNDRGGIECDLTVSRLGEHRFYIVTGTGFRTRDFHWITRHLPAGADVNLRDVTEETAVLTVMGPKSRLVLEQLTDADVSDAAVPFTSVVDLSVAGVRLRALRVTYVGELGWELHVDRGDAGVVYDALVVAGQPHGIMNAGYRAIESLRLEKGYRAWGSDIGPDRTPLEAGMTWAVKLNTDIGFNGRGAVAAQSADGTRARLACFTVDDPGVVLLGRETIYRNGERAGWLTSGGWGYTIEANIGYGYVQHDGGVDRAYLAAGSYELEVATRRVPEIGRAHV